MSHNERNYVFFQVLSRIETSYASIRGKDCRDCRFDCFCRCRATLSHLMCPSEDSWECRTDTVLKVLSNIESSHASIRGLLIVQIVLLLLMLSNIESCYASIRGLLGVHFLFFHRLWATLSYVMRPSEDCWVCRMYCAFSLTYFEQHWVILCTHLRTAWSAECSYFCRRWATLSHLMLPSEDCWECRCYCFFSICFEQHFV